MLTTSFGLFVVARTVMGALHGLFVAVGFVLAMSIVPPERMGRAISVVVSGLFVSTALGVPLGTLVGQALGWRGSFTAGAVLSVVVLIGTFANSSAVITGLIIAVIIIPVAWAAGFLKPPVIADATELAAATV